MNPTCTILLPVYNEEKSVYFVIESIQREIAPFVQEYEILVVDDGSTDRTAQILTECENVRILTHSKNKGYGASIKTGVRNALGKVVLMMDADSSYPEEQIWQMVELSEKYDMVVGARKSPFIRHFFIRGILRYLFKVTASILMRTWIPDLNSGMRVINTELCRKYVDYLPDGFSASSTLTAVFLMKNHSIQYIDIPYRTRIGISKLNVAVDAFKFLHYLLFTLQKSDMVNGNE